MPYANYHPSQYAFDCFLALTCLYVVVLFLCLLVILSINTRYLLSACERERERKRRNREKVQSSKNRFGFVYVVILQVYDNACGLFFKIRQMTILVLLDIV